jgi:hypothetical protein
MLLAAKRTLGLASLGLGIAAVVAPEGFARTLGWTRTPRASAPSARARSPPARASCRPSAPAHGCGCGSAAT